MKPEIQMFIAVSQQWKIESARQGLWERAQSCETDSLRPISPAAAAAETLEITTRDFKKLVLATRVAGMSKLLARGSPPPSRIAYTSAYPRLIYQKSANPLPRPSDKFFFDAK